ncbi:hypothetical protein B0O99DRAFT_527398 [Bisporella sp. PMI_857]|nr:hypothetical protein B0O99DRAFT_527398 [Bisporella sp. PMI_857]
MWSPNLKRRSFVQGDLEQHEQERHVTQNDAKHPPEESYEADRTTEYISQQDVDQLRQAHHDAIESKEREWETRERELQQHIVEISQRSEEDISILRTKLQESESEKLFMQSQHNAFVRKQQEASFSLMESARWLPTDEGKVMGDLDRLKRDMRAWAKATSVQGSSLTQLLKDGETTALMKDLANVARVENGQLPEGLSAVAKCPMLLLNALLAHNVYTSLFRSPFFFLSSGGNASSRIKPETLLEDIYEGAKAANQEETHIWRSQTLRLLLPPVRKDASDAEQQLRHMTESSINRSAEQQALDFLAGPASYLIESKGNEESTSKLKKIYSRAAGLSYMLWTRRTEMRCFTLHEIGNLAFNAESPYFDPDSLVKYDDHEDHLKGRMVTLIVHPLLQVYGTDEAKDYDQERVWAKGVVWLSSKKL